LKILVPIKRVPTPEQKLKVAADKLDLSGAQWQVNPFDEYAVETALRLTEKGKGGEHVGEVVLVSIGPKDVSTQLRGLLAMGADRALLIAGDDAELDADRVARILAGVVKTESPDLVLMGKQAVDGDDNQVGQLLAGYLGWPQGTFLASVVLAADGKSATITREVDAGVEEKRVPLPAVLTVDLRIIGKKAVRNAALAGADAEWEESQRYASLKGIMAAKKKEIRRVSPAAGTAARQQIVKLYVPEKSKKTQLISGSPAEAARELVKKLREEARVL
jgi:electron transfer flavoprotein beta subunit